MFARGMPFTDRNRPKIMALPSSWTAIASTCPPVEMRTLGKVAGEFCPKSASIASEQRQQIVTRDKPGCRSRVLFAFAKELVGLRFSIDLRKVNSNLIKRLILNLTLKRSLQQPSSPPQALRRFGLQNPRRQDGDTGIYRYRPVGPALPVSWLLRGDTSEINSVPRKALPSLHFALAIEAPCRDGRGVGR